MMRYLILMFSLTVFFSCQKEELSVQEAQIEEQQANALNAQLMGLIQTVASHDGAFDDVIDNSACLALNFHIPVSLMENYMQLIRRQI